MQGTRGVYTINVKRYHKLPVDNKLNTNKHWDYKGNIHKYIK